ncbi:MAG: hypothetical protein AAF441_22720 [Pseudomonadota bacterium]
MNRKWLEAKISRKSFLNFARALLAIGLPFHLKLPARGQKKGAFAEENHEIEVTARAPLLENGTEEFGYGLYSYLLFASRSDAGRTGRLRAIRAYLKLFGDASAAKNKRRNINIFYIPILNSAGALPIVAPDAQLDLLASQIEQNFDYARAQTWLNKLNMKEDGVYLISYFSELSEFLDAGAGYTAREIDKSKLLVQNLAYVPEDLIELWILEFRNQATRKDFWDQFTLRNVMKNIRTAVPHITKFVKFYGLLG